MKKLSKEAILLIVFVLIFTLLSIMSPGKFLTGGNLRSICFQIPEFGLFAIAMMLAILTGGINLSVVTSGTLGSVIGATRALTNVCGGHECGAFHHTGCVDGAGDFDSLWSAQRLCGFLHGTAAMMTTLGTSILYEGIGLADFKG